MKKYLLIFSFCLLAKLIVAQTGFGIDVGYSPARTLVADVRYFIDENAFSLGFTNKFNNALGQKLREKTSGSFVIGDGTYFFSVDFGYSRSVSAKFDVGGEVSIGAKKYYTNFTDNNFSSGGFHLIDRTKSVFGLGGIVTYHVTDNIGIFAGYNTLRTAMFGLQVKFFAKGG